MQRMIFIHGMMGTINGYGNGKGILNMLVTTDETGMCEGMLVTTDGTSNVSKTYKLVTNTCG